MVFVLSASKIQRQNNSTLSDEDKQFLSRVNNYGKQNGLHLSQQIQNKIKVRIFEAWMFLASQA